MILEKLNKPPSIKHPPSHFELVPPPPPPSSPKFEISAPGANSRIFGIGPYSCLMENLNRERGAAPPLNFHNLLLPSPPPPHPPPHPWAPRKMAWAPNF